MVPRRNIRLTLEYDGTRYHGWQRQKNALCLQEVIEQALAQITGETVRLIASGRTDAGVHAGGQVANFQTNSTAPLRAFVRGLNSLLPFDIAVLKAEEVPLEFHARYDARWKTYEYHILNRLVRSPLQHLYTWWIPEPLDVAALEAAARALPGDHDFSTFRAAGGRPGHAGRRVREAVWQSEPEGLLKFSISANGFLRGMVRSLVGTMAEVGRKKYPPDYLREALEKQDRSLAGPTAPPQGLFLVNVEYDVGGGGKGQWPLTPSPKPPPPIP